MHAADGGMHQLDYGIRSSYQGNLFVRYSHIQRKSLRDALNFHWLHFPYKRDACGSLSSLRSTLTAFPFLWGCKISGIFEQSFCSLLVLHFFRGGQINKWQIQLSTCSTYTDSKWTSILHSRSMSRPFILLWSKFELDFCRYLAILKFTTFSFASRWCSGFLSLSVQTSSAFNNPKR